MNESEIRIIELQALRAILDDQPDTHATIRAKRALTLAIEELTNEPE